jgi:hypothetical protein
MWLPHASSVPLARRTLSSIMSFGTYARTVRDERRPTGVRYLALRSAVELYRPLGFDATWTYVIGHTDARQETTDNLLRALEVLETSRAAWLRELAGYTERRRAEKRLGYLPRQDEVRYRFGFRWPGPGAHGATWYTVAALWDEQRRSALPAGLPGDWTSLAADVAACVESYLSAPDRPFVEDARLLRICSRELRLLPWDMTGYPEAARYRQRLTKLVELVTHDVLPLIRRGGVGDVVDPGLGVWVAEINGHVVGLVDGPDIP